jgi:hypothetical protein
MSLRPKGFPADLKFDEVPGGIRARYIRWESDDLARRGRDIGYVDISEGGGLDAAAERPLYWRACIDVHRAEQLIDDALEVIEPLTRGRARERK